MEVELRSTPAFTLRLLGYANHSDMGSYTEAIDAFRAGQDPTPDIEAHRQQGRTKYGGANAEQRFEGNEFEVLFQRWKTDGDVVLSDRGASGFLAAIKDGRGARDRSVAPLVRSVRRATTGS